MTSPRTLLTAWDIRAKKKLGQNFLKDPSTAQMIVDRSGIRSHEVVLEIGPGLGAMTIPIAKNASKVIAVDKDVRLTRLLNAELIASGVDNVTLVEADILKSEIEAYGRKKEEKLVVMGNLPYNISSQVLVKLVNARDRVDRAVLMFQKEMAQRMCASPGSKAYGRLAVMLAYCAKVEIIAQLKASMFFPQPKIDSTVVLISFLPVPKFPARDEKLLFDVVKAAFGKRRKTLKNALSGSDLEISGPQVEQLLDKAGINPMRRAETLSVEEFVALSNGLVDQYEKEVEHR